MHRQRLGEVVGHIVDARDVPNDELLLGHAVLKPMQSHVARLGELGFDSLLGEADSDFIIAVDDSGRLGISQVLKHLSLSSRNFIHPEGATIL
jgi:hypothetical protein